MKFNDNLSRVEQPSKKSNLPKLGSHSFSKEKFSVGEKLFLCRCRRLSKFLDETIFGHKFRVSSFFISNFDAIAFFQTKFFLECQFRALRLQQIPNRRF